MFKSTDDKEKILLLKRVMRGGDADTDNCVKGIYKTHSKGEDE
jgi:hypothetical protein